ncbi:MAG: thrS [Frankiales bacterium]|nr:thrS [Frankiales bacterium]
MSSAPSSSAAQQDPVQPDPARTVTVFAGNTPRSALEVAGIELTGPTGAVVVRDAAGNLRDLDVKFEFDEDVEPVSIDSPDGLAVLRHSAAHVLAQAVQDLFPNTLLGIGPPIENGFYYDFLPSRPFTPEDLTAIERKMNDIVKAAQRFSRREIADEQARVELKDQKFKLELIGLKGSGVNETPTELDAEEASQVGGGSLTMYDNLNRDGELVLSSRSR